MKYIVSVSGGLGSFEALRRTIHSHGRDNVVAVFSDVKGRGDSHFFAPFPSIEQLLHERYGGESRDLYRFIWQVSHLLNVPIIRLSGDDSIWTRFAKARAMRLYVGSGFYCPASEHLKRERIAQWIEQRFRPESYTMVLGMGWDEEHRVKRARYWWSKRMGWDVPVTSPNAMRPYADNDTIIAWLRARGVEPSNSYLDGFQHDNCGGGCVHGGQGHFALLYNTRPDVYLYWAYQELQIQTYLGKEVTILKDERGGETTRLSLYEFIPRIQRGDYRRQEISGCGCFTNSMFDLLAVADMGRVSAEGAL